MNTVSIWRRFEWDGAHRIAGHAGACKAIHGHRYVAEVEFGAAEIDSLGMVFDFGEIKKIVGGWIDAKLDHTAIFDTHDQDEAVLAVIALNERLGKPAYFLNSPPTVEGIVAELGVRIAELVAPHGISVLSIRLWETPNCSATWGAYRPRS